MSASITVSGGSTSVQSGQRVLEAFSVPNGNDVGVTLNTTLVTGDNTFTVPTGAVGVVILPWANQASATWTLRTNLNSSDSGLPIPYAHPFVFIFGPTAPTSIIIHALATSSPLNLWFW